MIRLAYLPLFVRDFLSDPIVLRMGWLDQALYLRMLMLSWDAGPLPDDPQLIGRMVDVPRLLGELQGLGAKFDTEAAILGILRLCWVLTGAGWVSPRLERERDRALDLARKRSEHGSKGARARWGSPRGMPGHSPGNGKQMPSQAQDQRIDSSSLPVEVFPGRKQLEVEGVQGEKEPSPEGAPPSAASPPQARRSRPKKPRWKGEIPLALAGERFAACWALWLRFRAEEARKPVTQVSGDQALAKLAAWGVERACAALEHSMAQGWQGIFEPHHERGEAPAAAPSAEFLATLDMAFARKRR